MNKFMSTLASIGLVDVTTTPDAPPPPHPDAAVAQSAPSLRLRSETDAVPGAVQPAANAALIASIDQGVRQQLATSVEHAGADLVAELSSLIDTLKENITEEGALYRMALKLIGKRGHTPHDLAGDYDKCIGAVEQAGRDFDAQLKRELASRVGGKEKEVADATAKIEALTAEINERQQQIATVTAERTKATAAIGAAQEKLDLTKSRFQAIYGETRAALQAARDKVTTYGGEH